MFDIPLTGKVFGIDTNVLMLNERAAERLAGLQTGKNDLLEMSEPPLGANTVIIPDIVLRELEGINKDKERGELVRMQARRARDRILALLHNSCECIESTVDHDPLISLTNLSNGGKIFYIHTTNLQQKPSLIDNDDKIIDCFMRLVKVNRNNKNAVFQLVTNDKYAQIRARQAFSAAYHGVVQPPDLERCTAALTSETVSDPNQTYLGWSEQTVSLEKLAEIDTTDFSRDQPTILQNRVIPVKNSFAIFHVGGVAHYRMFQQDEDYLRAKELNNEKRLRQLMEKINSPKPIPAIPSGYVTQKDLEGFIVQSEVGSRQRKRFLKGLTEINDQEALKQLWASVIKEEKQARRANENQADLLKYNLDLIPKYEQLFACEALMNSTCNIVTIQGPAGSGKTLWSVIAGLTQYAEGTFSRVRYLRPLVGVGEGVGFYKGGWEEKVMPWMQACKDAILEAYGINDLRGQERKKAIEGVSKLEDLGVIEYEIATHIAGRTWRKEFVIIDEAHLFTRAQLQLLIGRIGKETKIILLGDPTQIEGSEARRYLNSTNYGMGHVIDRMPGKPPYGELESSPCLFSHITLTDRVVMRSPAAKYAMYLNW